MGSRETKAGDNLACPIPAEIEFVKDDQGKVTSLVLHQEGQDMKAPRK